MKICLKAAIALSVLSSACSAFAAAPPALTGQWAVHSSIAGNEIDQVCTFVQTNNALTGDCKGDDKSHAITGSVDGTKVTWKYDSEYNGTAITLTYTATLGDAANFTGSVDVQPFEVSGEFTATPVPSTSK